MTCPLDPLKRPDFHRALIEGPLTAWIKLTRTGDRVQVPAKDGYPAYELEPRQCTCGSILHRPVGEQVAGDELVKHLRGIIDRFFKKALSQSHLRTQRQDPYIVIQANVGTMVLLDRLAKALAEELEKDDEGHQHCPGCTEPHL